MSAVPRVPLRLLAVSAALCFTSAVALATTVSGTTSQHGVVRVDLAKHHRLRGLIVQLWTRCSDHGRRDVWPGFEASFKHPQDASGRVSDSYDIIGRDAATGARFHQRASFRARITRTRVTGSAEVTQTLIANGVVCKSPRVSFRVHI